MVFLYTYKVISDLGENMKLDGVVFIFGLVFIGIPIIGLLAVFVEMFRGVI